MINQRVHYFPAQSCTVITGLCANGEYGASTEDFRDGRVKGYGHSRLAAIEDLTRLINEMAECDEEEFQQAAE